MPVTTLVGTPTSITAGDTVLFTTSYTSFPNTSWSAKYLLQIAGSAPVSINATNSGNLFLFTLNSSTTSNLAAGDYSFAIYATELSSSQRTTAESGILQVTPDLTQTQPLSDAATMLAQVDAAISGLTLGGFQSVSVNNVSYTRYQLAELIALRTRLQSEVAREQAAADALSGASGDGLIATRFL